LSIFCALAAATSRSFSAPSLSESMGMKARDFVADRYSRRSLADSYLHVLNDAIRSHGAAR
jgi:hypothetical protein